MKEKIAIAFLILLLFGGCIEPPSPNPTQKAKWVIMVYMDSDNNLEPNSVGDMDKLESVGSNEDIAIVVQWDRIPGYDESNGDWTGTKRFLILKGSEEGIVESQELMDLGEVDMGNMDSLTEFIRWAMQNYPAEHYLLDLWDHGGGWVPHTMDETNKSQATVQALADALGNAGFGPGNKLDLLVFNQCLMGQIDVAYAMQPYVKVMVASEDIIPGPGIAYPGPLSRLQQNPTMDEKQLAAELVQGYEKFYKEEAPNPFTTLAAYDLSKIGPVNDAMKQLTVVLKENVEQNWPAIGRSVYYAEAFAKFGGMQTIKASSSYDLLDFADLARQEIGNKELDQAVADLKNAVQGMLIAEYHGKEHPLATGLTAYFPEDEILYQPDYALESEFGAESGWNDFLQSYIAAEKTDTIAPSITIDRVSQQTASLTKPISVFGTATGNNIVSLTRTVGKIQGNKVFLINTHELTQTYKEYEGERKLPEFIDGKNNIDYTWTPIAEIITNGEQAVIAPLQPAGQSEYYFAAIGEYKSIDEAQPFDAKLVFDYRFGSLVGAVRFNEIDGKTVPNGFVPQQGDTFTPYIETVDLGTGEQNWQKIDSIQFGKNGLWLDLTLLPEGDYEIGLVVMDISGNMAPAFTSLTVAGQPAGDAALTAQDLAGKWLGEKIGFEILGDGTCVSSVGLRQNKCAYWFRNASLPLISFYIKTEESTEPIFAVFMAERKQNMLYLTEMLEGGKYALWKEGTAPQPEEEEAEIDAMLIGKWTNQLGNIEFKQDGSYIWEVGGSTIVGTFSASNGTIYLASKGRKTPYTYSVSGNSLELVDLEGNTLSFAKYTGVNPPANPLVGTWYNAAVNETAIFNADSTYQSYISGALFVSGTYSVSGNALALSSAYGTFYYVFSASGSVLTLYDPIYGTIVSYVKIG